MSLFGIRVQNSSGSLFKSYSTNPEEIIQNNAGGLFGPRSSGNFGEYKQKGWALFGVAINENQKPDVAIFGNISNNINSNNNKNSFGLTQNNNEVIRKKIIL